MRSRAMMRALSVLVAPSCRQSAAQFLLGAAELPRPVRKFLAVCIFLVVAVLTIGGGTLLIAAAMHAVVDRLDMPPHISLSVYGVAVHSYEKLHPSHRGKSAVELLFAVPRPTVAQAVNSAIIHAGNPADPFIQSDAVGLGLFLQREVHQLLTGVFDDATRTRVSWPVEPVGVPVANGQ